MTHTDGSIDQNSHNLKTYTSSKEFNIL